MKLLQKINSLFKREKEPQEQGVSMAISTKDMARMANARWAESANDYQPKSEKDYMMKKGIFLLGYYAAWRDMQDLGSGLYSMNELLNAHV
jgi:hypothetical protein